MAIPAVNLSYMGPAPTSNGERIAASNESGPSSKYLFAYGTATLDGAATTFTANFVDGTVTPFGSWSGSGANQSFTAAQPAIVDAYRLPGVNGTADTAASSTTAIVSAVSTTGVTITISAAGTSGQKLSFAVDVYPSLS